MESFSVTHGPDAAYYTFMVGVLVTLAAVFVLLMLTGAVSSRTQNYKSDMGIGGATAAAMQVACNSSGSTIYLTDDARVLRSRDYGSNWEVVLTNRKGESTE